MTVWVDTPGTELSLAPLAAGGVAYDCRCILDVAVGGIGPGETWKQAAQGKFDARWRQSLRALASRRSGLGPTFIRFAHEMNGNWYPWSVDADNVDDFRAAWKRYRAIQLDVFRDAFLVFSANHVSIGSDIAWTDMFPGVADVDVMGVDYYNQDPFIGSDAEFASTAMARGIGGEPVGIEAHRQYAQSIGLPLVIPEWGSSALLGDSPAFFSSFHAWIKSHSGRGPGQVLYENLFELPTDGGKWALYPNTQQPRSAAVYGSAWVR